ncbi:MAG TPA: hypothetical protein VGX25_25815 [Actinophytocola sp.]|uniref:hypothetical protein n=1 Tax=Actinophytocola sp. TaxID=1872138 RepID=UPI002DDD10A8|nr:hypothetical protein [Actinophytocola sp.]HEV2782823.1 hypothetical protein [Actinophytocola sp.]
MTTDALQLSAARRNPNAARIRLDLTVREATLLYALAYTAHASGTRVTASDTPAGDTDAATVLNWVTCKLYIGLCESRGRGL